VWGRFRGGAQAAPPRGWPYYNTTGPPNLKGAPKNWRPLGDPKTLPGAALGSYPALSLYALSKSESKLLACGAGVIAGP
jgi:hypothetical protein